MRRSTDWFRLLMQECYLWLWDRTGVRIATVTFVMFGMYVALSRTGQPWRWYDWTLTVLIALTSIPRWLQQRWGKYALMNKDADEYYHSRWYSWVWWIILISSLIDIVKMSTHDVLGDVFFSMYAMSLVVKVRERQPTERRQLAQERI